MKDINDKFEYDVAFSFLQQDERLAYEVNDLIQERFKTFIYSEQQKELAGTDGEKTFNEVFGEKSRIVIIFYRADWGKTSWTRIEETAIRNRAHSEGYDFTTFVQLEQNSSMPKWLPKTRIYYDFKRWGVKGLAPVIEAKVQEAGGKTKPDTLEDQVARHKRKLLNEKERIQFIDSNEGYTKAKIEFNKLYNILEKKLNELEDPQIDLHFEYEKQSEKRFIIHSEGYGLHFTWEYKFSNSLTDSGLYIDLFQKTRANTKAFLESYLYGQVKEDAIKREQLNFDIYPSTKQLGWSNKNNDNEFYTSEEIAIKWLTIFFERVSKAQIDRQKKK